MSTSHILARASRLRVLVRFITCPCTELLQESNPALDFSYTVLWEILTVTHTWWGRRKKKTTPALSLALNMFPSSSVSLLLTFLNTFCPFLFFYSSISDWFRPFNQEGGRQPQIKGNYQNSLTPQRQHTGFRIQCSLWLYHCTGRSPHCSRQDTGIHWAHFPLVALERKRWDVTGFNERTRGLAWNTSPWDRANRDRQGIKKKRAYVRHGLFYICCLCSKPRGSLLLHSQNS